MPRLSRLPLKRRLRAKSTPDLSSDKGGGASTRMVAAMADDVRATARCSVPLKCNSHLDATSTACSVHIVDSSLHSEYQTVPYVLIRLHTLLPVLPVEPHFRLACQHVQSVLTSSVQPISWTIMNSSQCQRVLIHSLSMKDS